MTFPNAKHYWKFDEGTGTTAVDSIGGVTIRIDRGTWQPSKHGTGLRFSPSNGARVVKTTLTADMPSPWTLGLWVMREADTESATLLSSNQSGLKLEQYSNTHSLGISQFGVSDSSFDYELPIGQWVYLTLVGTATDTTLYVNGKFQNSLPGSIKLPAHWIGSTQEYQEFASMVIDDLEIFDKALTATEVTELYNERSTDGGTLRWCWGWGHNSNGQLMDGTNSQRNLPTQIPYVGKVELKAVAAGYFHNLALLADGSVWAWGYNNWCQLGDGTAADRFAPSEVFHLRKFGTKAIAAGAFHSMALLQDGTVLAWGRNAHRQLGLDSGQPDRHPIPVAVPGLRGVKAIAAGAYHSIALLDDGTVWTWGHGAYGQLGNGTNSSYQSPVMVADLHGVKAIAAGVQHNLALLDDGSVWSWGLNDDGQLGDGTNTSRNKPVKVLNIAHVKAIASNPAGDNNDSYSLALLEDGTVWAWGYNYWGQLGDGTTTNGNKPSMVTNVTGAKAIAAGGWHGLALLQDGTVWAWGYNINGQLGDGTTSSRVKPGKVTGLSGIKAIAAGAQHSLAFG